MKHLLSALVVVGALAAMSSVASAQCGYTAYYAPHVTYYAPPAVYHPPVYRTYYRSYYRPWWGGYRYYARRPVVYYYGW